MRRQLTLEVVIAQKLLNFSKRIGDLASASDFGDYIRLLKIFVMIAGQDARSDMKMAFTKLYFAYFTFVDRPDMFDDADQLNEVDRLHTKLFNQNSMDVVHYKGFDLRGDCG